MRRSLLDSAVLLAAFWAAFLLRFEFDIPAESLNAMLVVTPFVFALQILALRLFGGHRVAGEYFSYSDIPSFAMAAGVWLVPMLAVRLLAPPGQWQIPISVTLIDTILATAGLMVVRLGQRFRAEVRYRRSLRWTDQKPVLLVGAGEAGAKVARELHCTDSELRVAGYVDDDPRKRGAAISGALVLGGIDDIPRIAREHNVDHVIVSIADPAPDLLQRIVDKCGEVPVRARSIPSYLDIVQGKRAITAFGDVEVGDLLGREPVSFSAHAEMLDLIRGHVVMVTGAGGSIGSELSRQVADIGPRLLLLVERFEGALFRVNRELGRANPDTARLALVADITDPDRMESIFNRYRPDVVVHAAAHKHVSVMEENPGEAIKNNTFGTRLVAELAGESAARCFVQVSTDKAVHPTSIMGMSKRLAEMVVQQCDETYCGTKFVAVRFGNVMGSSGSVVPIFKEQIREGGPVTVTHQEATRYFMTIPEASRLVLTAAAISKGGEVMVLDMGEPVRIIDLARNMIRLSGYLPNPTRSCTWPTKRWS